MKYLINILLLLFLFSASLNAQQEQENGDKDKDKDKEEKDGNYSGRVDVVGIHNPTLSDAFKIRKNPGLKKVEMEKEPANYPIKSKQLPVSFDLDPISPAKMVGDPLDKLYNNHMRIGMGTSTMPYFEYFYNNTRSREYAFGIHMKHLSASGEIDDHPFPGFSDNLAEVYLKKFSRKHVFSADVAYRRNVVHAYGIPESIYKDSLNSDVEKEDIEIAYHNISASVGYKSQYSSYEDDKLHHDLNLDFYYLFNNEESRELNLNFEADVHKKVSWLKSADEQALGLEAEADYFNNQWDSIDGVNSGLFRITPYLESKLKSIDLDLGANIMIEDDSVSSRIRFYPDLHINMELIKNIFVLKGGIYGETSRDNIYSWSRKNPFMHSFVPLDYEYDRSVIYAGINASISKNIDFNSYFEAYDTENASFFMRDSREPYANRFHVKHDSVRSIHISADVSFRVKDKLKINLGGDYHEYSMTALAEAWNRPDIEAHLSARYNLQEKIIIKGELFYIGKRKAKGLVDGSFETVTLDPVFDGNLSAEYRYNKVLSGFLRFRNLAAGSYERWASYPTYGFQFMAGVTYSL